MIKTLIIILAFIATGCLVVQSYISVDNHPIETKTQIPLPNYSPEDIKVLEAPIKIEVQRVKQDSNIAMEVSQAAKYMNSEEYRLEGDEVD